MFKPHLCCDLDLTKIKYPVAVMPKIDGTRLLNVNGKATGRSMKAYKNQKLTEYFSKPEFSGLDGELADGFPTDADLCRKTTSCVNKIKGEIPKYWWVFDYNTPETAHLGFVERHAILCELTDTLNDEHVMLVEYSIIDSEEELLELYNEYLSQGYEGVIVRSLDGKHKDGRCTVNEGSYLRLKPSADAEAIVVSLTEAMENQNEAKINELGHTERSTHKENLVGKGMIGSLVCKDLQTGSLINVGAGKLTHEERKYYWEHPEKIIGQMIKYRSLQTGIKDAPRHARLISGEFLTERLKEDMV